jgi:predicted heme/steroid binding protein
MERMLEAPERPKSDATRADEDEQRSERVAWWLSLQATSTRRALLLTALGGLLIAGLITALPRNDTTNGLTAGAISLGPRGSGTFNHAKGGDCLNWPERTPDAAEIVDCKDEHRFEVAESVDMRSFPGSEYGPDAAPPSAARIQQITQEQCSVAVKHYLGARFDPNSRFTTSLLWSGDKAWRQSGERRMLCGLQLAGPNNQQIAFKGKVADVDQSKVWPAGTCLGIDPSTNQPTDIPIDCAAPHAMEATGAVNLAEKFPDALPPEPEQDGFIKDACTRMTDAYLAPVQLRSTTLTLIYSTVSLPSWSAGSHQVSCSIGATLGNGGWSTLLNSAKGPLLINGQPPIAPPDIPLDRLNLPPIPVIEPPQMPVDTSSQIAGIQTTDPGQQTQHMPQQSIGPGSTASQTAPTQPPPQANTFLNGPPPPPGEDVPPFPQGPGVPPGPAVPAQGPGVPPGPAVPAQGPGAPPGAQAPPPAPDAGQSPAPIGPPPGEPAPPPPGQ